MADNPRNPDSEEGSSQKRRRLEHGDSREEQSEEETMISLADLKEEVIVTVTEALSSGDEDEEVDDDATQFFMMSDSESEEDEVEPSSAANVAPEPGLPWVPHNPHIPIIPFSSRRELRQTPTGQTPYDFFRLMLTDDIIDHVVTESNVYAERLVWNNSCPKSRIAKWKPLTKEEFLVFLGLVFHTGTIKLSRLSSYWSSKDTLDGVLHIPIFSETMARDRFLLILQALHFGRNPTCDDSPTDRLYKVRPIIELFNQTMETVFSPGRQLSIDESMVLWRGRLFCRQYLQTKRHKCGIKLYVLGEKNGLSLKFLLHAGSQDVSGLGHASKVVKKLLHGRTGVGHSLYCDQFLNSVQLTKELLNEKTYVTGKLRKNQDNPTDVTRAALRKHETVQRFTPEGICVIKWRDKREVLMISSETSGDLVNVTNRRGKVSQKPLMVKTYNDMCGVDKMDQLLAYYPFERKTLKWYKKLAIHVFHLMLINSFILYNNYSAEGRRSFYDFRLDVIRRLLTTTYSRRPKVRDAPLGNHFPTLSELKAGERTNEHKRKVCRHCKKTTKYLCMACPRDKKGDPLGLCPECFQPYHCR